MKHFRSAVIAALSAICALLSQRAAQGQICDEFLSVPGCIVVLDMSSVAGEITPSYSVRPPAQSDVTVNSAATVTVRMENASPFLACSVSESPGAVTRDLGTSFSGALTTLGTAVFPAALPQMNPAEQVRNFEATRAPSRLRGPAEIRLKAIDDERMALSTLEETAFNGLQSQSDQLKTTMRQNWRYSFSSTANADTAVDNLTRDVNALLRQPLPDLAGIQIRTKKMQDDLAAFYKDFPAPDPDIATLAAATGGDVASAAANADLLQAGASDLRKKEKQILDFLSNSAPAADRSQILLHLTRFRQKAVGETITCKDRMTGIQPFDAISFTVYYENTPIFDISVGALVSFLPGRQVGLVSGPEGGSSAPSTSGPCGPSSPAMGGPESCLGITSTTKPQFMPAVFFELHPRNLGRIPLTGKCRWATNGAPRHPFGYVCSLGVAGGFAVNPNNGTASAEFFEGLSFSIQRVSFLFGFHNGRYQTFTEGYYAGEAVPSTLVPPTERKWTTHFAIGLTYRIPFR